MVGIVGGNSVTTAIITNGLWCSTALESGMITTYFSLHVRTPIEIYGGGNYYPKEAWNKVPDIQNFYKPYTEEWEYKRLEDIDVRKRKHVVLKITIGEFQHEKEFVVAEKTAKIVVSITNIFNTTKTNIQMKVTNLKTFTKKLVAKINKIRVSKTKE